MATINDVAARAGVSRTTTSRVLNNRPKVDEETRRRVSHAIEELEYVPSPTARRLSLGRTWTVDVIASYLTRPQAIERLRGAESVLGDTGFDLVDPQRRDRLSAGERYLRELPYLEPDRWRPARLPAAHLRQPSRVGGGTGSSGRDRRPRPGRRGSARRARRRRRRWRARGPLPVHARPPRDRFRRRLFRQPVRLHVEPRPLRRLRGGCSTSSASRWRPHSAHTDRGARAISRCACSRALVPPRRSSPRATPRRSGS